MSRTVIAVAAVLAALTVAVTAPAASADHEEVDCGFDTVAHSGSDRYDGVAYGWVVAPDDTVSSIRCEITVDGVVAASTPTETGAGAAVTAAEVSFVADDTQIVNICAVYTTNHGTVHCEPMAPKPFPPTVVWETVTGVVYAADPVVCEGLKALSPGAGSVYVNEQGDVYVDGEPVWDCPPYDIWPAG